jgi:hypothetical protein
VNKIWTYIKNSQGTIALTIAATIFVLNPYIIAAIWPSTMDPGIIVPGSFFAILAFAAVIFFFGNWVAWKAYESDFWGLDKYFSDIQEIFQQLTPFQKICALIAPFFLLLSFFAFSFLVAILILSTI